MKIEKLTENKIRIILKKNDLKNKSIDVKKLFFSSIESQSLFLEILEKAKNEVDFDIDGHKLLIETFFEDSDCIVFIITKYIEKKQKKYKLSKDNFNTSKNSCYIYQIEDFEHFCNFCSCINKNIDLKNLFKSSILYFYNDIFYLVIFRPNIKNADFNLISSILPEFFNVCDNTKNFEFILEEHGKVIMKNNAIIKGIKFFCKKQIHNLR